MRRQLLVDHPRHRLVGRGPIAVAAAEHGVAQLGKGILRQIAAQPFDELGGVVGRRTVVGGAEDQHPALLREFSHVIVERRELCGKTVDLGEVGDAGGKFLRTAEIGAIETSSGVLCPGRVRALGVAAFVDPVAAGTPPANAPRSRSLRGRTLILKPSGLIVSVSFRCIW